MKRLAQIFSMLLHPLLVVCYATVLYDLLFPHDITFIPKILLLVIVSGLFIMTFILPGLWSLILQRLQRIQSLEMNEKNERNSPLVATIICYGFTIFLLRGFGDKFFFISDFVFFIEAFVFAAMLALAVAFFVNLRWKISLHMIGMGGLCGGISAAFILLHSGNPLWLAALAVVAGLLGSARLLLDTHSPAQLLAGFTTGFLIEFTVVNYCREIQHFFFG